jgi:lysophospholipase L1-like esterase
MSFEQRHAPLRVTFFGDSICVGQGVSIYNGWVTRIAGRLERIGESYQCEIIVTNTSVNGNTTRQALERMPYDVQSHGVDILIVQFGMNDCNYWETDRGLPRVSPQGFAANLKEIVARGRTFGAKQIILNNNHPTMRDQKQFPGASKTYEENNRHYNAIVRKIASDMPKDVIFIDIEAAFDKITEKDRGKLEGLLLSDGLHLSRKGHEVYFKVVADKIERCVMEAIEARA